MRFDPRMRGEHHDGMQLLYFVIGLQIEARCNPSALLRLS